MPKKSASMSHLVWSPGKPFNLGFDTSTNRPADNFVESIFYERFARMGEHPKFFMTNAALRTFSASNYEMVIQMVREGVIGLPRKDMVLELQMSDLELARYFFVFEQMEDAPQKYLCMIVQYSNETDSSMVLPICFEVDLQAGSEVLIPAVGNVPWFTGLTEWDIQNELARYNMPQAVNMKILGKQSNFLRAATQLAITAFLALYITRGIEKREIVYGPEENRKRKRMGLKPMVTHTVINLDRQIQYLADKTYRDKEGKLRMRLHWRCGHKKMQAHGPGRTLRKEMWIAPYMVGCDEHGMVTHDYSFKGKREPNDNRQCADAPEVKAGAPILQSG